MADKTPEDTPDDTPEDSPPDTPSATPVEHQFPGQTYRDKSTSASSKDSDSGPNSKLNPLHKPASNNADEP